MSENPTSGRRDSLRRRAGQGIAVSLAGQVAAQLLRLGGNLVLSRLLFPEAFGLMALVFLVLNGLQLVSDVGINASVIRHERGEDPAFRDTAWTLQILRGIGLWLVGSASAPAIARFYGEPELAALIPAAAAGALLGGLQSIRLLTEMRRVRLGWNVAVELGAQAVGMAAMIAIAWIHPSTWALVAGGLVTAATKSILSHVALPGPREHLRWDAQALREIVSFGRWVLVSTLFTYLALQVDVALLGKLVPVAMLGVYSIGAMVPNVLRDVSGRLLQTVMLPVLSESHRRGRGDLERGFAQIRSLLLPAGLLGALAGAAAAPAFFHGLYEPRYADAAWIAQLAMIRLWFTVLHGSTGLVLLAVGDSRGHALANLARTIAIALGCVLGFRIGELPGLIVGAGVGAAAGYLVLAALVAQYRVSVLAADAAYSGLGLLLGGVIGVLPRLLSPWVGPSWLDAAILLVGLSLLLPLAGLAWRTSRGILAGGAG
jgi:O-antigen/teichoic acid export membrane protein